MRLLAIAALVFSASPALAAPYEVGVRIGGYGFRREPTASADSPAGVANVRWDECRMNGLGVFGNHALRGPLFVEAGLDMYSSIGPTQRGDLPLDRTSGLISGAIGARTQVASWLGAYIQLGAGVELARLSVPYGDTRISDQKAMPEGFFGFGGDIRVTASTHIGANLRTLVMGNFDYDGGGIRMDGGWGAPPSKSVLFAATPDVAAQAQFYVRRDL